MGFVEGVNRHQLIMFPESLDEYIDEDNPVRFVDAFVDSLDVQALGFKHAVAKETGRPPYNPRTQLKLFIYGYLNRIRSSRKLEQEAGRNVELMWLLGKLAPDFKTIADFRRENGKAIRAVCRQFVLLCREMDMFGGELVAIDGSKFKAVNSGSRNYSKKKLKKLVQRVDEKIENYMEELQANDEQEPDNYKPTKKELKEKIAVLKKRKEKYERLEEEIEQSGETQVSLTDPDARSMRMGGGGIDVGYNVQISVDEKHKLILDHEVTNAITDQGQLSRMASRAKEALGAEKLDVVADMGYYDGREVKSCLEEKVTPYIPKPDTSANSRLGLYGKKDFRYDAEEDCYWCPAGEALIFRFQTTENGRDIKYYATTACKECELGSKCTRNKRGRRITRWVDEALLEEMEQRVRADPEKMGKRKCIVEHPFGTMKRSMDQGYFLMRRLSNVKTEMSLTVLSYNIKRMIQIMGVEGMIKALA
jgi:transposase/macrodomain Ter protein organizer (MatP/YcbG family)